jgi:hypothetical protein
MLTNPLVLDTVIVVIGVTFVTMKVELVMIYMTSYRLVILYFPVIRNEIKHDILVSHELLIY